MLKELKTIKLLHKKCRHHINNKLQNCAKYIVIKILQNDLQQMLNLHEKNQLQAITSSINSTHGDNVLVALHTTT